MLVKQPFVTVDPKRQKYTDSPPANIFFPLNLALESSVVFYLWNLFISSWPSILSALTSAWKTYPILLKFPSYTDLFFILRPKTESSWSKQLPCLRARNLRRQELSPLRERPQGGSVQQLMDSWVRVGDLAGPWEVQAFLRNFYFITVILVWLQWAEWKHLVRAVLWLHAWMLGVLSSLALSHCQSSLPFPLPLLSTTSFVSLLVLLYFLLVSLFFFPVVVTAQCYVQNDFFFVHHCILPYPWANSSALIPYHCHPLNFENCHVKTWYNGWGFLSPINLLLQGILLGFFPGILCINFGISRLRNIT